MLSDVLMVVFFVKVLIVESIRFVWQWRYAKVVLSVSHSSVNAFHVEDSLCLVG